MKFAISFTVMSNDEEYNVQDQVVIFKLMKKIFGPLGKGFAIKKANSYVGVLHFLFLVDDKAAPLIHRMIHNRRGSAEVIMLGELAHKMSKKLSKKLGKEVEFNAHMLSALG